MENPFDRPFYKLRSGAGIERYPQFLHNNRYFSLFSYNKAGLQALFNRTCFVKKSFIIRVPFIDEGWLLLLHPVLVRRTWQ